MDNVSKINKRPWTLITPVQDQICSSFNKTNLVNKNTMGRLDTERSILGNLFGCFKCCGSTKNEHLASDHVLQPLNLFNPGRQTTSIDQLVEDSRAARKRLYQKLGSLQDFALTEAAQVPPLVGAPRWPSQNKQNFLVIKRSNSNVIIVSDGLSDPFDDLQADANVNGWGLEFFVETTAAEIGNTASEIKASWQFQLLYTVCSLAAGHGGIRHIIDDMQLLSTEAEGVSEAIPEEGRKGHVNRAARVGALLGLTDTQPSSPTCEYICISRAKGKETSSSQNV